MNQSLSFALYRTYAIPGIGSLLRQTGEFTQRTQKRYDHTALVGWAPSPAGCPVPHAAGTQVQPDAP